MIQGKPTLVVDFGNSSTKCTVLFGKDSTGRYRERRFELSNVFSFIEEGYEVSSDYSDATSTILNVNSHVNGMSVVGNFCNGELQERERALSTIKPSAFDKKYNLEATVLSLRMAFLYAYKAVMNMQRVSDVSQLDLTWTVVTLLPPGDIDTGREAMTNLIKEITYVDAVFPKMRMSVKIDNVAILPEGFCAYAAVVYDKGQIFRMGYEYLKDETIMIFDIGAGTTDCMIIRKNKLIQDSKHTVEQGGNNVHNLVRKELRMRGIDLDEQSIIEGVIKGKVRDGAKDISIVDIVNQAKRTVAQKITSDFQDYLSTVDIRMRSIGYVLVCGGGSMSDVSCPDIVPLSASIIELLKKLSPNMELIELPKVPVTTTDDTGNSQTKNVELSARMLNLVGASILAESM